MSDGRARPPLAGRARPRAESRRCRPGTARQAFRAWCGPADPTREAATSAPTEGRVIYAGMRSLAVPSNPAARLWHRATMLFEHRGDGTPHRSPRRCARRPGVRSTVSRSARAGEPTAAALPHPTATGGVSTSVQRPAGPSRVRRARCRPDRARTAA
ncbi:helix-turn-helix domain-containing protein [Streptomyces cellostaticus]|uniref:helix-turn-helix domain-containing protein n=1 Tax=Streptomyces cellostaticus TaxID=67285 RepID=UPI0035A8D361